MPSIKKEHPEIKDMSKKSKSGPELRVAKKAKGPKQVHVEKKMSPEECKNPSKSAYKSPSNPESPSKWKTTNIAIKKTR